MIGNYWGILSVTAIILVAAISIYNRIIYQRNLVREAWSNIDVQLKRRHNLIPNLVETVKKYMSYEQQVLNEITDKRNEGVSLEEGGLSSSLLNTENKLSDALKQFWGIVEDYPDLKADSTFLRLQQQLSEVEDHIQLSRRYYNGTVRDLNTTIESFPNNLIAIIFGFKIESFFQIDNPMSRVPAQVKLSSD